MDTPAVLQNWVETQEMALARGFKGLRLTGNTHWVEQKDWHPFEQYESLVTETFKPHRIIALCSYCLERTHSEGVLDVVRNHQFAVVRRQGEWEMIENADHKKTKNELFRTNQQLEERVAQRTAELEKMLRVRDEFLSIASHELKTPLASLKLQIDSTLRAKKKGMINEEEVFKRLSKAEVQCRRMDSLVSNLLDISRSGTGKLPIHIQETDLSELLSEVVERFSEQASLKGCELKLKAPSKIVGEWDRMRLDQVVTNLVSNAIRYAPGSKIEIGLKQNGDKVSFTVRDNGPGIPESSHQKIFDRFTKLDNQNNADGFGLGLWIVKQIIERFSGNISVASRAGGGAEFKVDLPLKYTHGIHETLCPHQRA